MRRKSFSNVGEEKSFPCSEQSDRSELEKLGFSTAWLSISCVTLDG